MGGTFAWPAVAEVMKYRKQVFEIVLDVIDNAPLELPVTQEHPWVGRHNNMQHVQNCCYDFHHVSVYFCVFFLTLTVNN